MSDVLNLFPARVAIGKWRDPGTGKDIPVLMTTEFERALAALFRRVGGAISLSNEDIAILTAGPDGAASTAAAIARAAALELQPAAAVVNAARVADLEAQVATLQSQIALFAKAAKRLDDFDRLMPADPNAAIGQLAKRASDLEYGATVVPISYMDWTRPGKIGSSTPNTGAFTTLTTSGNVGLGTVPTSSQRVAISVSPTGGTTIDGVSLIETVQSDVTTLHRGMYTSIGTQAAAFTLTDMRHYSAQQGTFGAGSTVTNQVGFYVGSGLTGATNNYAFFANMPAAAARWNFYAAGTANNAFVGKVRIGSAVAPTVELDVTGAIAVSGQITSTVSTGTAPLVIASTTKVSNLNADLLDGTDWAAPGTIGGTTPASASFTSINASGQITSTVTTGTAPMVIASTTKVTNLNVDLLDGKDWVAPGPIGGTTPDTGAFTSLTTTGAADSIFGLGTTINRLFVNGSNSGTGGGTRITVQNGGTSIIAIGNKSTIEGGAYDATPIIYANATIYVYQGMDINGDVKIIGKSGFNNTAPIAKPSVTGSRAGNAALASLLTQLSNYGLITDSTTA